VSEEDILTYRNSEQMSALLKYQAERAQQYYDSAYSFLAEQDRYAQRSGLIMAAIYEQLLKTIVKRNYPVLVGRVSLNPLQKLWLAWNTARKEKLRHQKYLHTCQT
ncbi:squalene/phytoene synthase family protein, partial [Kaarinaea lacus]